MNRKAILAKRRKDKGFTLIELLIVIAILGILSTIVVLSVRGITDRGQTSACDTDKKTVETAYEAAVANGYTFTGTTDVTSELVPDYLHAVSANYTISSTGAASAIAKADGGKCA